MAQGFASLTKERRSEISRMGGKRAGELGKAHRWTAEEARSAGIKGGLKVSADRDHMAEIGKLGGAQTKKARF